MPSPRTGLHASPSFCMTFARFSLVVCLLTATLPAAARRTTHVTAKATHSSVRHKLRKSTRNSVRHMEAPAIGGERATQIQTALIRKGYLSGEPSGNWDAQTISAMQKLQSDNGWQSKVTPDARALIKLGLGPAPLAPAVTSSSPQR